MLLATWMQFCKLSRTLLSINIKTVSLQLIFFVLLRSSGKMMFGQAICFLDTHCQWRNPNLERNTLVGLGDNQSKQHLKLLQHHSQEARSWLILITSKLQNHSPLDIVALIPGLGLQVNSFLCYRSFKGWQKKAITEFLAEQNINVGKPNDFT